MNGIDMSSQPKMDTSKPLDNGGPAFPCEVGGDPANNQHQTGNYTAMWYGMSLRDWFAGKALAGMCAGEPGSHLIPKNAAHEAYLYADAMMKARGAA